MKRLFAPTLLVLTCCLVLSPSSVADSANWSGFRGDGTGVASGRELPLIWNDEKGIVWKKGLEGFGQSSPIIWNNTVYVTSTGGNQKEHLYLEAFALKSGERKWLRTIPASKNVEKVSRMISQGAPTPMAGPEGVFAFFESGDLVAFSHEGKELWKRDLQKQFGDFQGNHGIGSSLVAAPGRLLLLLDHGGPSYLLCLDRKTGTTVWKAGREPRVSWSTPVYHEWKGEGQILISSNGVVESYRFVDGERIWWVEGVKKNTVASPAVGGGLVIIGSSDPRQSMAIRMGGFGNVSETHIAWRAEGATSSFASPMIGQDKAYIVNRTGMLHAQDLESGKLVWKQRLPEAAWASPICDGKRIYYFCKNGKTVVLGAGSVTPKILAENAIPLGKDDTLYGVAAAKKSFVLRSGRKIYLVGSADHSN